LDDPADEQLHGVRDDALGPRGESPPESLSHVTLPSPKGQLPAHHRPFARKESEPDGSHSRARRRRYLAYCQHKFATDIRLPPSRGGRRIPCVCPSWVLVACLRTQ
jgi:hypothetical protein